MKRFFVALTALLALAAPVVAGDTFGIPGPQGVGGTGGGGGGVTSVHGTTDQVNVTGTTGSVTFSLPQSVATTSTPQFAGLGIGGTAPATGFKVLTGFAAVGSQTVTYSQPVFSGDQVWNNAGAVFDADSYAITDTASLGSSTLIQRKVGGASKFAVYKNGQIATALYALPAVDGSAYQVMTTDGAGHLYFATVVGTGGGGGSGTVQPGVDGLRLTLSSTLPVTVSDVTAATTLYALPYKSTHISLYSGSAWLDDIVGSGGVSLAVSGFPSSGTASTLYDIFAYDSGGTVTLEALAWTTSAFGTSARATALAYQDGVLVKSGTATRRYLGTVYLDGSTKLDDSGAGGTSTGRFVWNVTNQVPVRDIGISATSWSDGTATWHIPPTGDACWSHYFVTGYSDTSPTAHLHIEVNLTSGTSPALVEAALNGTVTNAFANSALGGTGGGGYGVTISTSWASNPNISVVVNGLNKFEALVNPDGSTVTFCAYGVGSTFLVEGMR